MSTIFEADADFETLAEDSRSEDPARRVVAALALRDSGADDAISLLAKLITDRDPQVRRSAAEALGAFETAEAARALIFALTDASEAVRETAAASLAETKDVEAAGDLIPLVTHAKTFVRKSALRALKSLRSAEAFPVAAHALGDPDPEVRVQAIAPLLISNATTALHSLPRRRLTQCRSFARRLSRLYHFRVPLSCGTP